MKIPIYINGLLPINRDKRADNEDGGSRVNIKIIKDRLDEIEHTMTADLNGEIEIFVPDKYVDAAITIHIRHRWYKNTDFSDTIKSFGFFYSAKINHDFTFWTDSPSTDPEWQTEVEYLKASNKKNEKLRHFRFKNRFIRFSYFTILIGAPLAGYFFTGIIGVAFGLFVALVLELLGPYSIGLKRLF